MNAPCDRALLEVAKRNPASEAVEARHVRPESIRGVSVKDLLCNIGS